MVKELPVDTVTPLLAVRVQSFERISLTSPETTTRLEIVSEWSTTYQPSFATSFQVVVEVSTTVAVTGLCAVPDAFTYSTFSAFAALTVETKLLPPPPEGWRLS